MNPYLIVIIGYPLMLLTGVWLAIKWQAEKMQRLKDENYFLAEENEQLEQRNERLLDEVDALKKAVNGGIDFSITAPAPFLQSKHAKILDEFIHSHGFTICGENDILILKS